MNLIVYNIKNFYFKNPLVFWFVTFFLNTYLQIKERKKHLKIGSMSYVSRCSFGKYNTIYDNVICKESEIDDYTYITSGTKISKSKIGKFCSIGPSCKIGLGIHPSTNYVSTHPIFFSTSRQAQITFVEKNYFQESKEIFIGNDVWIGANVIIIDGVKIGDGAIVAAGAVVTADIPEYAIVGGVPAKIIKYRFNKSQIYFLHELNWFAKEESWLKENVELFHDINKMQKPKNYNE